MIKIGKRKLPLPGFRNIKTAIAVFICICVYTLMGRQSNMLFAVTAALICMQGSIERTLSSGFNRIAGTMIGGVCGLCFSLLKGLNLNFFIWGFLVSFVLVLLIYFLNLNNKNDSLVIACFVFLSITLDPSMTDPEFYAFYRILDTTIGIIISIGVNHFLFRPEFDRQELKDVYEKNKSFRYRVKRNVNHQTTNWAGGVATELLIFPERAAFSERNFIWRLSSSTTDFRETTFSKLIGYKRHFLLLNGNAKIIQGANSFNLSKYESVDLISEEEVKCVGLCTDLNLVISNSYEGLIEKYHCFEKHAIKNYNQDKEPYETKLIYSLFDELDLKIEIDEHEKFEVVLNKGDLFILENIESLNDESSITVYKQNRTEFDVVAITSLIRKRT